MLLQATCSATTLLPEKHALRVVRADAGFFDQQLLGFLEQRGLSYIIVARLTLWLKREAARVTAWRALDEHYAAGEFFLQLFGWDRPRRFVVIRERLRAERPSLGRKLLDSSALVAVKPIASQPRCAHKFFFAVLCSAGPATAWCCICRLPGVASNHASRCWKTPYPTVSQLRRSCILGSRLEPKIHQ